MEILVPAGTRRAGGRPVRHGTAGPLRHEPLRTSRRRRTGPGRGPRMGRPFPARGVHRAPIGFGRCRNQIFRSDAIQGDAPRQKPPGDPVPPHRCSRRPLVVHLPCAADRRRPGTVRRSPVGTTLLAPRRSSRRSSPSSPERRDGERGGLKDLGHAGYPHRAPRVGFPRDSGLVGTPSAQPRRRSMQQMVPTNLTPGRPPSLESAHPAPADPETTVRTVLRQVGRDQGDLPTKSPRHSPWAFGGSRRWGDQIPREITECSGN